MSKLVGAARQRAACAFDASNMLVIHCVHDDFSIQYLSSKDWDCLKHYPKRCVGKVLMFGCLKCFKQIHLCAAFFLRCYQNCPAHFPKEVYVTSPLDTLKSMNKMDGAAVCQKRGSPV